MLNKIIRLTLFWCLYNFSSFAGEGMWLPLMLQQLNEKEMQDMGMKISAEDIYSINKSSMKDAVVLFGGGCTGELISPSGLLLTNHHCGFGQIQSHSTLEHDYLKNGFWAFEQKDEIPCPGLSVTFIVSMHDVTADVLKGVTAETDEAVRETIINAASELLIKKYTDQTHYKAIVKPFYNGNQYFLFVTETFEDVRMVGAPPSSIGKFGGDTDNWMWPRHTGDFSMFRIYANADNQPAPYAPGNQPYKPKHFFPVNIKGVQPGDFTMVYGFPGRTYQFYTSPAVKTIMEINDPIRIKVRTARLNVIDEAMRSSDKLRIQYANKQVSIANGWKKWQGELRGLERLNIVEVKQQQEKQFQAWADQGHTAYAKVLPELNALYEKYRPLTAAADYINEAGYGAEILKYARKFNKLADSDSAAFMKSESEKLKGEVSGSFKDLDIPTDKKLFAATLEIYYKDAARNMIPAELELIYTKYKGDFMTAANDLYAKSMLTDSLKVHAMLSNWNSKKAKQLKTDPLYILSKQFYDLYNQNVRSDLLALNDQIEIQNRKYIAGLMEFDTTRRFYPDANSTLRVAYGKVEGYYPRDAVVYEYYTTLEGVMEKEDNSVEEFEVPAKLKSLFQTKDYGRYAHNGKLPVAFIASNHTTGGNSGSPVLNANGELIGTNFDRVWEGTMSDIDFDPEMCRNISLDIRYTLFIIDKYAGCKRLLDEMTIIQ